MSQLKDFKALVVDDDPDLRELVSEDLIREGALVDTACCGEEALTLIQSKNYDFVISDMRMPNGDGRFVAEGLLKLKSPKPILFVYSGYNDLTPSDSAYLNIAYIFAKPFKASQMISTILTKIK